MSPHIGEVDVQFTAQCIGATVTEDRPLKIGDVRIEAAGTALLIGLGGSVTLVIRPREPSDGPSREKGWSVKCFRIGERLLEQANRQSEIANGQSEAPLVRLGPGGDFTKDWPEGSA